MKFGDVLPVKCSPFVVLLRWQGPCLYKLVQQQPHVLSGDGAALKRRLDGVPHKHIEQRGTVELCHALQRLLQHQRENTQKTLAIRAVAGEPDDVHAFK